MVDLPRFVVAAPATGQGKTTVSIGLMAALRNAGHEVSGHKVGPDYIDPGYHALACGRPGRNLDPHLVGEERIAPLLLHGAAGADVAVIEGVMGLYDGRIGGDGFSSTAHVARLTASPVILVVDISRSSRSIGAIVHGMATFTGAPEIAGVILNQAGSPRQVAEVVSSIDLPVLGALGRDAAVAVPSRHLGLVPAAERDEAAHALDTLAARVAADIDLHAVLAVARAAPDLDAVVWDPVAALRGVSTGSTTNGTGSTGGRPVVAMAGGRAFTFRYAETEDLLRAAGCDVVTFDPTTDTRLPAGTSGIYLGGGFPEVHAADLAANAALLTDLRAALAAGVPTVAECAGLLYLARTLDEVAMVAAIPATAAMSPRLTLRYPRVGTPADSLLGRAGEEVTGHEFHRTTTEPAAPADADAGWVPAWTIDGTDVGFASDTVHASYLHVHWAGHPHLAARFADAVHAARPHEPPHPPSDEPVPSAVEPVDTPTDPLRHHGDVEAVGLADFAVNVYPGPPPPWLRIALEQGLDDAGEYPSATAAEAALAARHGRDPGEVLATAGAAEAFSLLARLRPWHRPVVVHPQFTEPHDALAQAGHTVTSVLTDPADGFVLHPDAVPHDADLVVVGNPTNPTGVLHPRTTLEALLRPGRTVLVDEAFTDTVPGEAETLTGDPRFVVVRSLTKHWGIPGVRAGYLLADADTVTALRRLQVPWSVSSTAAAAMVACAGADPTGRAADIVAWRTALESALTARGIEHVASSASFVLARPGLGVHARLRAAGIAVRRGDTFPGLGPEWVRIAVRPPAATVVLLDALDALG